MDVSGHVDDSVFGHPDIDQDGTVVAIEAFGQLEDAVDKLAMQQSLLSKPQLDLGHVSGLDIRRDHGSLIVQADVKVGVKVDQAAKGVPGALAPQTPTNIDLVLERELAKRVFVLLGPAQHVEDVHAEMVWGVESGLMLGLISRLFSLLSLFATAHKPELVPEESSLFFSSRAGPV